MSGVTKGRVTQWVTAGLIDGAALVGEGRSAMIDVDLARAQLIERRAVNESCGLNGLNTKLGPDAPSEAPSNATGAAPTPHHPAPEAREGEDPATVDARIKAEKLKQNEILTRKQEICPNAIRGSCIVKEKTVWEVEVQIFRSKRALFESGNRFEKIDKPLVDVKGQPLATTPILP